MHLSYCGNSGAAKICQWGPKRGSEATEREPGEGVGGGKHGREIFLKIRVSKRNFLNIECHY